MSAVYDYVPVNSFHAVCKREPEVIKFSLLQWGAPTASAQNM